MVSGYGYTEQDHGATSPFGIQSQATGTVVPMGGSKEELRAENITEEVMLP
jgi:hypothetical protein